MVTGAFGTSGGGLRVILFGGKLESWNSESEETDQNRSQKKRTYSENSQRFSSDLKTCICSGGMVYCCAY